MDDWLSPDPGDVLAVTDLTRRIKRLLEGELGRLWVRGEVSNLRRQSSGHIYFSLKDSGSQLPCVLFARDAARQSFRLEDGMELILFGELSVYEPHGRYQLIGKVALPGGQGRLQLEYERLKRKLAAEGLFAAERKQRLPRLPRRIAVITSPSGAALRDFLQILKRRGFAGQLVLLPARVQGREAPAEIRAMLERAVADGGFDAIVLTRGGGSIEDLWAFNDEALARAVAASPVPVISAVGHEIDHVLTDYAADCRAETPSGAAELISSCYIDAGERLRAQSEALQAALADLLRDQRHRSDRLSGRLQLIAPQRQVQLLGMQLDDHDSRMRQALAGRLGRLQRDAGTLSERLQRHNPISRLELQRQALEHRAQRLRRLASTGFERRRRDLTHTAQRLENTGLQATLRRGYAVLEDGEGRILAKVKEAEAAASIRARLQDGTLDLK